MTTGESCTRHFPVEAYDLAATLDSGQAFRWACVDGAWTGVLRNRWVRLRQVGGFIQATLAEPCSEWQWLADYLQLDVDLDAVLRTFPKDEPMQRAVQTCHGLRLLRQDPWECLASFILSSSKQIVQIRQIVAAVCQCFGETVPTPKGVSPAFAFPTPSTISSLSEADLRACKMGYRAPYLLETARMLAAGFDLEALRQMSVSRARDELLKLPGVGRKVADCVLLFAYGFQEAFPVDVWVMKALRQLYFPRRRVSLKQLHRFAATHFGPYSGYAQQYLFHYMRLQKRFIQKPKERR